jgi:hypothetical protein
MQLNLDKLKKEFEENPTATMAVMGVLATGAAKLVMAVVSARNSRTWNREVNRRIKNSRR